MTQDIDTGIDSEIAHGRSDRPLRVGIVADFLEERWPSMDLVAAMLVGELKTQREMAVEAEILRPPFLRPLTRVAGLKGSRRSHNAERALNRYLNYPLWLRQVRRKYDLFHVIDHSYAHLVNYLPAAQTIVTCHDLDTFRPLLEPSQEPRSAAFRAVIRHVLKGLRRAAIVTCNSRTTRSAIVNAGIRKPEDIVVVPYGVDPDLTAEPDADAERQTDELLAGGAPGAIDVVHVGSGEPRKRIDLLLEVFAGIAREFPMARLIRVGGQLSDRDAANARALHVDDRIVTIPFAAHRVLAAIYRRAAMVLMPSESEGFGLPVIEALACGAPVIATDIAVLREVGGEAAHFCGLGDIESWVAAAKRVLGERTAMSEPFAKRRAAGIAWAAQFSWRNYAARTAQVYRRIATSEARAAGGSESLIGTN